MSFPKVNNLLIYLPFKRGSQKIRGLEILFYSNDVTLLRDRDGGGSDLDAIIKTFTTVTFTLMRGSSLNEGRAL